jgi:hypothetical protein
MGTAGGGISGIVPVDTLLLGRTDHVAVAVTGLSAFSAGIEIFVTARIRPSAGHPGEHLPGGPRDLAASRRSFRFGLQFSDGGKAAGSPGGRRPDHDSEPAGPVLYPFAGGGGPHSFVSRWWMWPLPPADLSRPGPAPAGVRSRGPSTTRAAAGGPNPADRDLRLAWSGIPVPPQNALAPECPILTSTDQLSGRARCRWPFACLTVPRARPRCRACG